MATLKKGRGHPEIFNAAQNAALRAALRSVKDRRHYSQVALGNIMGVGQQAASRLLKNEDAGFSYESASRLVRHLGFSNVETFFRSRNVTRPSEPPRAQSA